MPVQDHRTKPADAAQKDSRPVQQIQQGLYPVVNRVTSAVLVVGALKPVQHLGINLLWRCQADLV
jgi:hypothetical protein